MITRISGTVNRVLGEEVRLQVGPVEYQLLVPDFVRRPLQHKQGEEVTLYTMEYFEGNPMQGRMVPRLIGFLNEAEQDFFELFCTVDKVGVRKALKALIQPIKDIAGAIQRQDSHWLTMLPGIGPATAEQVIATLRRKVTRFALMPARKGQDQEPAADDAVVTSLIEDAYQALLSVGHQPQEARNRLDKALATGRSFSSVEDILLEIYKQSSG